MLTLLPVVSLPCLQADDVFSTTTTRLWSLGSLSEDVVVVSLVNAGGR